MPAIYHEGSWLGNATDPEVLVKDTVGWTGKNLLPNNATSRTINGITFTVNADGSVTVNGTATADADLTINNTKTFKAGSYILNGSPSGSSGTSYYLVVGGKGRDYGNGIAFTIDSDSVLTIYIRIVSGTTVNNLTFYPMLRRADITDPTYEPYHESVEVMYEEEIHGVNLLKNESSTATHLGVTFTVNPDGSITANGTSTGVSNYVLVTDLSKYQGLGDLYLTGCPEDGGESKYEIIVCNSDGVSFYHSATDHTKVRDFGNGTSLNVDTIQSGNSTPVNLKQGSIRILIRSGQTVSNLVFRPMLRKADIEDSTYRPYNNQAIQNQLNAQGVLGAKNLLPNNATSQTVNGVTFTVNSDGSVTANGTATADAIFVVNDNFVIPTGNYILSTHEISDGNNIHYSVVKMPGNTVLKEVKSTDEQPFTVNYSGYSYLKFTVWVRSGTTVSNKTAYPMLRLASDPDDTYQPYAMTNRELTEYNKGFNFLKFLFNADGSDVYSGNLNDLHAGYAYYSNAAVNIPANSYGYCITLERPSTYNYAVQIAITVTGGSVSMYVRKKANNTWEAWKTVTMS